ncbi:uncharacterized protein LOC117646402 [Thrips palmi]|uniref:Uncharacterized protein LOC117646402 n=1 Tax=Thrips palmi TaxID=161013 RepID=A0A6P8Z0Q3_THRPL|nr:uncharacterized protein LOC117646402 [Thrips palmi]
MSTPIMVPLTKLLSALWTPSIPLGNPSKLPSEGLQDSCTRGFHFLVRLAWESRYMIPVMYAVFSFLFDIQMRLEIIVLRERVPIHEVEEEEEEEDAFPALGQEEDLMQESESLGAPSEPDSPLEGEDDQ